VGPTSVDTCIGKRLGGASDKLDPRSSMGKESLGHLEEFHIADFREQEVRERLPFCTEGGGRVWTVLTHFSRWIIASKKNELGVTGGSPRKKGLREKKKRERVKKIKAMQ